MELVHQPQLSKVCLSVRGASSFQKVTLYLHILPSPLFYSLTRQLALAFLIMPLSRFPFLMSKEFRIPSISSIPSHPIPRHYARRTFTFMCPTTRATSNASKNATNKFFPPMASKTQRTNAHSFSGPSTK